MHEIGEDFGDFRKSIYFVTYVHEILCAVKDMVEVVNMERRCKEKTDELNERQDNY